MGYPLRPPKHPLPLGTSFVRWKGHNIIKVGTRRTVTFNPVPVAGGNMSDTAAPLSAELVAAIRIYQYTSVATTCFVLHDSVLTLPREVEHVWGRRTTLPRALYALTKLMGILILGTLSLLGILGPSEAGCAIFSFLLCYANITMALLGDSLILWRVTALWKGMKRTQLAILCSYYGTWIGEVQIIMFVSRSITPIILRAPSSAACWHAEEQSHSSLLLLGLSGSSLALQLGFVLLIMFSPHTRRKEEQPVLQPLLQMLKGEVAVYFAGFIVTQLVNIVIAVNYYDVAPMRFLGVPLTIAWQCLGPCRLYLHLKTGRWDSAPDEDSHAADREPMSDRDGSSANASSTWSTYGSTRSIGTATLRRRLAGSRGSREEEDADRRREALQVLTALDEDSDPEESGHLQEGEEVCFASWKGER